MSLIPKKDAYDITEEESVFLRSSKVPAEVRSFIARNHGDVGAQVRAYQKVAALARAETEALLAVRERAVVHGEMAQVAEARQRVAMVERRANALEVKLAQKDEAIAHLTAAPAMVVHSGGRDV